MIKQVLKNLEKLGDFLFDSTILFFIALIYLTNILGEYTQIVLTLYFSSLVAVLPLFYILAFVLVFKVIKKYGFLEVMQDFNGYIQKELNNENNNN